VKTIKFQECRLFMDCIATQSVTTAERDKKNSLFFSGQIVLLNNNLTALFPLPLKEVNYA